MSLAAELDRPDASRPAPPGPRLALRWLQVRRVRDLTPGLRRIVLGSESLADLHVPPDALGPYLKLLIPPPGDDRSGWPVCGREGRLVWPATGVRPALRTYSIRSFDPIAREIALDVVLHGGGVACGWARQARPGASIATWGPGIVPRPASDFVVLAGDHSGLPALAFILENLPADMRGHAFVEVPDVGEKLPLKAPGGVTVTWLIRGSAEAPSALPDRVRSVALPEESRAALWAGAEAGIARAIRAHARTILPLDRINVLNYWKRGASEGAFDYCG